MELRERLKLLIRNTIHPMLKERGFRKRNHHFYRPLEEVGWIFQVQSSKYNTRDFLQFTLNMGIYVPQWARLTGQTVSDFPKEYQSLWRERVRGDHWYELTPGTELAALRREIARDLQEQVIPFFERLSGLPPLLEEMLEAYRMGRLSVYAGKDIAILLTLSNRREEAADLLKRVAAYCREDDTVIDHIRQHRFQRLKELADKLGISL